MSTFGYSTFAIVIGVSLLAVFARNNHAVRKYVIAVFSVFLAILAFGTYLAAPRIALDSIKDRATRTTPDILEGILAMGHVHAILDGLLFIVAITFAILAARPPKNAPGA